MANSVLVCTTSKNVCTATISSASDTKFVNKSTGQKSSSNRKRVMRLECCNQRQVNTFQVPVKYIINFLFEKIDKGLQYTTLNCLGSAVSVDHINIDGTSVGKFFLYW